MRKVRFAVRHTQRRADARTTDDDAFGNGCDVRMVCADINDDAAERVCRVDLCNGSFNDSKTGDIQPFEEDLADALVRRS